MKTNLIYSAATACFLLAGSDPAQAGAIAFDPAITISATTDVSAAGTPAFAYCWSPGSPAVNGVTFTSTAANSGTIGGNLTLAGFGSGSGGAFSVTNQPYGTLPAAYRGVVSGAVYGATGATGTVTLLNLTSGRTYLVQAWVNDPRAGATTARMQNVTSPGGNTQLMKFNTAATVGSPGQLVNGRFTADNTNQVFTLLPPVTNLLPQLNAIQVRDITGAAPYWNGSQNASLDNTSTNFDGGQTLPQVAATFPQTFFSDNNGAGSPVVNTALTVVAGGALIPAMVFQNTNTTYTLASADANGLRGNSSLTLQGPGRVILNGANSFSGNVTVSRGLLSLRHSNALGTSAKTATATVPAAGFEVEGGITIPAGIAWVLSNNGTATVAVRNVSGTNVLQGPIRMTSGGGYPRIVVDAGSRLTLSGVVTNLITTGVRALLLDGAGEGLVSGAIVDGTTTNYSSVQKVGAGLWSLSANNTFQGGVLAQAGELRIAAGGRLANSAINTVMVESAATLVISNINAIAADHGVACLTPIFVSGTLVVQRENRAGPITLSGGTLLADSANTTYGAFLLQDSVTVTGAAPSVITNTAMAGAFFPICRSNSLSTLFTVEDVAAGADLRVYARLADLQASQGALTKAGPGTMWLGGANTYTGRTTVSAGTLALGTAGSLVSTAITVAAGAVFDVTEKAGFVLASGQTLLGAGLVTGDVVAAAGAQVQPGTVAGAGALAVGGSLSFQAGAVAVIDLGVGTGDAVQVTGNLEPSNAVIRVNPLAPLASGVYTVLTYTGTSATDFDPAVQKTVAGREAVSIDETGTVGVVKLVVASNAPQALAWNPAVSADWDLGTSNWVDAATRTVTDRFYEADTVLFDDAGAASNAINLATTVRPAAVFANGSGNYTMAGLGAIANPAFEVAALGKDGTGTLTLGTTNSYAGGTTVSNGTLAVAVNGALGTGAVTMIGGTLAGAGGSNTVANSVAVNGASIGLNDGGGNLTLSGALRGPGGIVKRGAGTVNMIPAGPHSYAGGTTVEEGTLRLGYSNGGSNLGTIQGVLTIQTGAVVNAAVEKAIGFAHSPSGNVLRVYVNEGLLNFTGANGLGGGQTVFLQGGEIRSNGGTNAPAAAGYYRFTTSTNDPTLYTLASAIPAVMSGRVQLDGTATINTEEGAASPDLRIDASITGGNGLNKQGPGRLLLTGTNTFTGETGIQTGTLALGTSGTLSNSSAVRLTPGAVFDVTAQPAWLMSANQALVGGGFVLGDVIARTGSVVRPGGQGLVQTLTFSNNLGLHAGATVGFDLTDVTSVGGGTNDLAIVAGRLEPSNSVIVVNQLKPLTAGTYTLAIHDGTKTTFFNPAVQGNGSRQSWTLDESTVPTVVALVVTGGFENLVWRPQANAAWDLASSNWFVTSSSTTDRFYQFDTVLFDDSGAYSNNVTISGALTPLGLTVNASSNYTLTGPGAIGGTNGLLKQGAGRLVLNSTNTHTGGTRVEGGVLSVASSGNLGSAAVSNGVTLDGGTLELTANITPPANRKLVIGAAGGTITGTGLAGFTAAPEDTLKGSGPLTVTGTAGTHTLLQISGAQSNFSGSVNIASGRININNAAGTLGTGEITVGGGTASLYLGNRPTLANVINIQSDGGEARGAVRFESGGTLLGPLVLLSNASVGVEGVNTGVISGPVTGAYTFTLGPTNAGNDGVYHLLASNAQAATVVRKGILGITNDNALGVAGGPLTLASASYSTLRALGDGVVLPASRPIALGGAISATLDSGAYTMTVYSAMSGTGPLYKAGSGALVLAGASSYAGATAATNGTLVIGVNNALPVTTAFSLGGGTSVAHLDVSGFSQTIASLTAGPNNPAPNRITIGAGQTLSVAGNVSVGNNSAGNTRTTLTVSGPGNLVVSGTTYQVGAATGAANYDAPTNDMSQLATFAANLGAGGTMRVGNTASSSPGVTPFFSTLILASNSTITAGTLGVGDNCGQGINFSQLRFGSGSNILNVATFNIGQAFAQRSSGDAAFSGATGGLRLRGAAGGSSRSTLNILNHASTTGTALTGLLNLAGHEADLLLGTVTIASRLATSTLGDTGTLIFDTGTLDATSVVLGRRQSTGGASLGTLAVGGGSATLGGVTLADSLTAGGTANGTLSITGGVVTLLGNIRKGASVGAGTAAVNLGGGTLRAGASFTNESAVAINLTGTGGDGRLDSATNALYIASDISGAGGFAKIGAGDLILSGTSTFAGVMAISNGTVFFNGAGTLAGGAQVATGATLRGSGTLTGLVAVLGGGQLMPGAATGAAPLTLASLTLRDGAVVQAFAGGTDALVRVTATDGFSADGGTGAVDILAGTLATGTYTVIDYEGSLQDGDASSFQLRSYAPRLGLSLVENVGNSSLDLVVTNTGEAIRWTGAASALWNINTTTNWQTALGSVPTAYLQPAAIGDAVIFDDSAPGNYTVTVAQAVQPLSLTVSNSLTGYAFSGAPIGGFTGLEKDGTARLALALTNTFTGATRVRAGTLALGSDAALGAAPLVLAPSQLVVEAGATLEAAAGFALSPLRGLTLGTPALGGSVTLDTRTNDVTIGAPIGNQGTATAGLTKAGAGRLILMSTNTYAGLTTIGAGTLQLGAANILPDGAGKGDLLLNGALDLAGFSESVNELAGTGQVTNSGAPATFTINNVQPTGAFAGAISGPVNFTKAGTGSLYLAAQQTYAGTTTITSATAPGVSAASRIVIGTHNALPPSTVLSRNNANLWLNGYTQELAGLISANSHSIYNGSTNKGTLILNVSANPTIGYLGDGATGSNATFDLVLKSRSGTNAFLLSGNSDFVGDTTIYSNAVAQIDGANSLGVGASTITLDEGKIVGTAAAAILGTNKLLVLGPNGGHLQAGGGAAVLYLTVNGRITGAGPLRIVRDTGILTLGGTNNDYTGDTIIGTVGPLYYAPGTQTRLKLGASEVIPNGAGKGNVTLVQTNFAQLDLNGMTETINGLSGDGRVLNLAGAGSLRVGDNDASSTFDGRFENNLALTKIGTGALTLTGNSTNTGQITVSAGTLALTGSGSFSNAGLVRVQAAGTLDVSARPGFTVAGGQILFGRGTVTGDVATLPGAQIRPDGFNSVNTLTFRNALNLNAGSTNWFDLTGATDVGGGTNDLVVVGGLLEPSNSVIVVNPLLPLASGTYTLFTYTGAKSTTFNTNVLGNTSRKSWTLDEGTAGQVNLLVSGGYASLVWRPDLNANWDIATSTNWYDALGANTTVFYNADAVTFDDSGAYSNVVSLIGDLQPTSVVVNASSNYTLQGAGRLVGAMALLKQGPSTLTIDATNLFTGGTIISNGTVTILSASALGVGPATIASNAALSIGTAGLTVTNAFAGTGAINANTLGIGTTSLILTNGLTTFAGTFNVGPGAAGAGKVVLDTPLAAAATVNLSNNATLYLRYGGTHPAAITLEGGDTGESMGQIRVEFDTVVAGPVTLAGVITGAGDGFIGNNYTGNLGFISGNIGESGGPRELSKVAPGTIVLTGTNTYSGGTRLAGGVLAVPQISDIGPSGISTSGPLVFAGGTLRYTGLADANTARSVTNPGTATWEIANAVALTLTGPMAGAGLISKIGDGTLVWSNNLTQITGGGLRVKRGTLILADAVVNNSAAVDDYVGDAAGDAGILIMRGNSVYTRLNSIRIGEQAGSRGEWRIEDNARLVSQGGGYIHVGNASTGLLYLTGGSISHNGANAFFIGNNNASVGAMYQTGGSIYNNPEFDIAYQGGGASYGFYLMTGGALTNNNWIQAGRGGSGAGLLYQAGGYITNLNSGTGFVLGNTSGGGNGRGVMYFTGGVGAGNRMGIGWAGAGRGEVTIDDAATVNIGATGVLLNQAGTTFGVLNLNGGTLLAPKIYKNVAGGMSIVNFNGGLWQITGAGTVLGPGAGGVGAVDGAFVQGGGALLDDGGLTNIIAQPLLAPAGNGVSSISLTGSIAGYVGAPYVSVTGGGGSNATAVALFDHVSGSVTGIVVTSPGQGYSTVPTITLSGGGRANDSVSALASNAANVSGGLTKLGPGRITLSGSNTFTGPTLVSNGTLLVNGSLATGALTVASGATLGGTGVIAGPVTCAGRTAPGPNAAGQLSLSLTYAQATNGALAVEIGGTVPGVSHDVLVVGNEASLNGALNVSLIGGFLPGPGSNSFTILRAGSRVGTFTTAALVPALGGLGLNVTYTPTSVVVDVTGTASAVVWRPTTAADWDLVSTNWFDPVALTTGVYVQGLPALFDDAGAYSNDVNLTLALLPNRVVVDSSSNYTFSGTGSLAGGMTLTKAGSGTLLLTTSNSYPGLTTVSNGTLQIGAGGAAGTVVGPIVNHGTLIHSRSDNATLSQVISGTGSFIKQGAGALTFSAANTYAGSSTISTGTLVLINENSGQLGSGLITVDNGGLLWLQPGSTGNAYNFTNSFAINGGTIRGEDGNQHLATGPGATIAIGALGGTVQATWPTKDVFLDGLLTGSAGLTLSHGTTVGGAATIHVANAANTYSGIVSVGGGTGITLRLDQPTALQYASVNLSNGTLVLANLGGGRIAGLSGGSGSVRPTPVAGTYTLTINNSNSFAFGGSLTNNTGILALVKTGGGTQTLSGASTFSGGTRISNGTLTVNGNLGTGSVYVAAGGTLAGTGSAGATTNAGLVAVGDAGIESLAVASYRALPGSTLAVELAGTLTPGTDHDLLAVGGAAALDGTLSVTTNGGFVPVDGNMFTVLTATSITGNFAATNLPVLGPDLFWSVQYSLTSVMLVVTQAPPLSGYDLWAQAIPNPSDRSAQADPDLDGYVNLWEYSQGTDPTNSASSMKVLMVKTNGVFALKFNRVVAATDLVYHVEASYAFTNGTDWTEISSNAFGTGWNGDASVTETNAGPVVQVFAEDNDPGVPQRGLRLQVERP